MFKLKNLLKDKLPRDFGAFLSPPKEFLPRLRRIFLTEFNLRFGREHYSVRGIKLFITKIVASFILFFGLAGGLVAYADSANVNPNHPLYPLKRYGESVRLAFAKAVDKPVLLAGFAHRRLKEIKNIEEFDNTERALIQVKLLRREMRESFSKSLDDDEDNGEATNKSCVALGGFTGDDSPHVDMMFGRYPELFQKFQEKCSNILENNQDI